MKKTKKNENEILKAIRILTEANIPVALLLDIEDIYITGRLRFDVDNLIKFFEKQSFDANKMSLFTFIRKKYNKNVVDAIIKFLWNSTSIKIIILLLIIKKMQEEE